MTETEIIELVIRGGGRDVETKIDRDGHRDAYAVSYKRPSGDQQRYGVYVPKGTDAVVAYEALASSLRERGSGLELT